MRRKSKKSICYFLCGCFFGFLLNYIYNNAWKTTVQFIGHDVAPSNYRIERKAIFNDVKHLYGNNSKEAILLSQQVRVLCWVMTQENTLLSKAQAVKDTWGRRCNVLVFFSSSFNNDFPAIKLNALEGYENLWFKTKTAWEYIHDNYIHDADWFIKTDDDTFVILENLRYFLSKYKTKDAHYFGRNFKHLKNDYNSGGAGYVFSKEALTSFISVLDRCHPKTTSEDIATAKCLAKVDIYPGETRDKIGKDTFHPFAPDFHIIPGAIEKENWLHRYNKWEVVSGFDCCSSHSITFHYTTSKRMYLFYYYLYRINNLKS